MSKWFEIEDDDIEISTNGNGREGLSADIYVTYDDSGSIYAVLTFQQIENLYSAMKRFPK